MKFCPFFHYRIVILVFIYLSLPNLTLNSQTQSKKLYISVSPYGNDIFSNISTSFENDATFETFRIGYFNVGLMYKFEISKNFKLSSLISFSTLKYNFAYNISNQIDNDVILFTNDRNANYNILAVGINAGYTIGRFGLSVGASLCKANYINSNFEDNYGTISVIFDIPNQSTAIFEFKENNYFYFYNPYYLATQLEFSYQLVKWINIKSGLIGNFSNPNELYNYTISGNKTIMGTMIPIYQMASLNSQYIIWSLGLEVAIF